jgi:hypothetical protein
MSTSGSDNNKDMMRILRMIGATPGFTLADAKSGNFTAIRMALKHAGHDIPEAKKSLSIRSVNDSFLNAIKDLAKKTGWTEQLHDDIAEISRAARVSGEPADRAITERLMDAFKPGWNDAPVIPENETDQERLERVRHDRMKAVAAGSSKAKAGKATTGISGAPAQVLEGRGEIRPEFISPDRALDLLCTIADYQRKLKPERVKEFKGKMSNGEWMLLASDPICIDRDGKLCNGQHRLEAVYQLEVGQEFYVAYDVDPETYDKMDRGTRRTAADMLYGKYRSRGEVRRDVSARDHSALLRMLFLWENEPQERWASLLRDVQEAQIHQADESHPYAADSVANGALRKIKIRPTASMHAHYMIAHAHDFDPEVVKILNQWYEEMRKPRLIRPGDPAFALREWFMGGEMERLAKRKSLPTRVHEQMLQTYLILRAWDNTTIGKSMQRLSWKPEFQIGTAARITGRTSFPPTT